MLYQHSLISFTYKEKGICYEKYLEVELGNVNIFIALGYPLDNINYAIYKTKAKLYFMLFSPKKCPVYLKLA